MFAGPHVGTAIDIPIARPPKGFSEAIGFDGSHLCCCPKPPGSAAGAATTAPAAGASAMPDNPFLPPFYRTDADVAERQPHQRHSLHPHARDVFLSHAQVSGGDIALALSTALLAADVTSWYDMNMTPFGLTNETMREGVRRCALFCFLLSKGALTRAAVRMELAEALAQRKRALLLIVEGMTPADVAREVEEGVAAIRAAAAGDKWVEEGDLRAFVAEIARAPVLLGERLQSVTAQAIIAALNAVEDADADDAAAAASAAAVAASERPTVRPRRRRRRALAQRLGTHTVGAAAAAAASAAAPVLLLGVRGNAYVEYLRQALNLACPTMPIAVFGDAKGGIEVMKEDSLKGADAASAAGGLEKEVVEPPPPSHIVALLEPALFEDAAAVRLLEAQPLDRLQLLFHRSDGGSFGRIMAATPPALASRTLYANINALAIERDVEKRWPDLCKVLSRLGAERRSDSLPVPPLPPAFDPSICAATLDALRGALDSLGAVRACVVGGLGGLGKTSAASVFASSARTQDAFDCVLWRTVGRSAGRGALRDALNDILRALLGSLPDDAAASLDLEQLAARVRCALERPQCRTLLVLDDLSDAEHGEHFRVLSGVIPAAPSRSLVLATTRNVALAARFLPAASTLTCHMEALSVHVAVRFLSRAVPHLSGCAPSLGALSDELGRSPYALQLAARILRQTAVDDFGSAAAAVDDIRGRIAAAPLSASLTSGAAPVGSAPVYRTIEVAFARTFSQVEREVFYAFSLFPEDADVPIGLLCAAWNRNEADRDELVQRLANAALIKRDGACIQLHDFALDFARAERSAAAIAEKQRLFLDRAKAQLCGGRQGNDGERGDSPSWAAIDSVSDGPVQAYLFRSLSHHLRAAGRAGEFTELVFSLDWLAVAIQHKGVHDVIRDVLEHARAEGGAAAIELRHLFQTLQFSAPGLREGAAMRERLVAQLVGRLRGVAGIVQEGTRMGRLLAEAEAFADEAIAMAAAATGPPSEAAGTAAWLLPVARTANLRGPGGALQATLVGHTDFVRCACLLENGLLASASDDRTVRLWDVSSGECLKTLAGHEQRVNSVTSLGVGPDGSGLLASASADKCIFVWNTSSGECLRVLHGHEGSVNSICALGREVSEGSGRSLASASDDKTVRIWDTTSGLCLKTLVGHEDKVVCVCELVCGGPESSGLLASASDDRSVRIWNSVSGECCRTLTGHEGGVIGVCSVWLEGPAESGGGILLVSASADKTLRISDAASGLCRQILTGHKGWVRGVCAFAGPAGSVLLASASSDMTVRVWSARSGECIQSLVGHEDRVVGVCSLGGFGGRGLDNSSSLLASAALDKTVRIWNVWNVGSGASARSSLSGHEDYVKCVCALGGGLFASASWDRTVRIWDGDDGACLQTLVGHSSRVLSVCSLRGPDGSGLLASASEDKTVRVWSVSSGACVKTLVGHADFVVSVCSVDVGGSGLLASASWDKTVRIWDGNSGECLMTLTGHEDKVVCVSSLQGPDGNGLIASASDDKTVRVWNTRSGACVEVLDRASQRGRQLMLRDGDVPAVTPSRLFSFRSSNAAFLDADVTFVCPLRSRSKGRPFDTIGVFTAAHQFLVYAILPNRGDPSCISPSF